MSDVMLGAFAVLAGAPFCYRGYMGMRLLIPIWGAFTGFTVGAGLVASIVGGGFLASVTGWLVGFAFAVVLAGLAYLYYAVSVVVIMGSTGFLIGAALMVALDVAWTWLVGPVAVTAGIALAFVAVVVDLPRVMLTLVTALGGAAAVTVGLMLFAGAVDGDDLSSADVVTRIEFDWWWFAIYLIVSVTGMVSQTRSAQQLHLSVQEASRSQRRPSTDRHH